MGNHQREGQSRQQEPFIFPRKLSPFLGTCWDLITTYRFLYSPKCVFKEEEKRTTHFETVTT